MIRSFGDRTTENLFHGHETRETRRFQKDLVRAALRKLDMLNAAASLNDLKVPPGNRLEALKGDLAGKFSIRVDSRWRVVFRWDLDSAWDVQLMDYHG